MNSWKQWMLGIVLAALAGGLSVDLAPSGKGQAKVRFVSGLLLLLALLRPLGTLTGTWETATSTLPMPTETDNLEIQQAAFSAIIADKTEAYIWDKANRLGLDCTVTVTTALSDSGLPLPDRVIIGGPYSAALSAYIEEEVDIPAKKQIWLEENA